MSRVSRRGMRGGPAVGGLLSAAAPTLLAGEQRAARRAAAQPRGKPADLPDGPIRGFLVVGPSTVGVNEEFSIGIKALAEPYVVGTACFRQAPSLAGPFNLSPRGIAYMDNVPKQWDGSVQIRAEGGYRGPDGLAFKGRPGPYANDSRPIARLGGLRFAEPGIQRIEIADPVSGVRALSNPIEVTASPPPERLFWGDIHCQTYFSDGLRCPEELCAFARHEAFLDIFALSDHVEYLTGRQWEYFVGVTNDSNDPGRFVTLVGSEWTSRGFGHRNLYFPGDRAPCVRSNDPVQGKLDELYAIARREGAIVIPHHSANVTIGVDWPLGHDPEVERLVEVYSIWGSSERPAADGNPRPIRTMGGEKAGRHVLDALRRGYRLGLIASGDIHDGRPGDELHRLQKSPAAYASLSPQGLVGVWAEKLTRQSVFQALWNRRVFGTTGVRTILRFSVCGQPMGGQIRHRGPRPIALEVQSPLPIAAVEIVRNGEVATRLQPQAAEARYHGEDPGSGGAGDWYYARVTHDTGDMAWSSPVWVDSAA